MDSFTQVSDAAYEAHGFTTEEAIVHGCRALFSHYYALEGIGHTHSLTVGERADSLEDAIAGVLDDLLSHSQESGVVFTEFFVESLESRGGAHSLKLKAMGGIPEQDAKRKGVEYTTLPTVSLQKTERGQVQMRVELHERE